MWVSKSSIGSVKKFYRVSALQDLPPCVLNVCPVCLSLICSKLLHLRQIKRYFIMLRLLSWLIVKHALPVFKRASNAPIHIYTYIYNIYTDFWASLGSLDFTGFVGIFKNATVYSFTVNCIHFYGKLYTNLLPTVYSFTVF